MDLNLVATFARVVESGSFTAAARGLGVPTSSVSRAVTRLEEHLGVRLLQRTTRSLSTTEAGARYYQRVRGALGDLGDAGDAVSDLGHEPRGTVRVTAPQDVAGQLLAGIFARFAERHPHITVELSLDNRRIDLVTEGFDLALRAGLLEDSTLVARRVLESELCVFGASSYLKQHGRPRTVGDLAKHRCVRMRSRVVGLVPWRLQGPRGVEHVEVSGPLVADDFGFISGAVAAGLGLGLLPDVQSHVGGLERVLPRHAVRGGALYLVWPSARHVPLRVALLRDHLIAELKRMRKERRV
jgi:DNA-binding transcriptional LysR family regulator